MKKIISLVLVFVMLLGLVGCSLTNNEDNSVEGVEENIEFALGEEFELGDYRIVVDNMRTGDRIGYIPSTTVYGNRVFQTSDEYFCQATNDTSTSIAYMVPVTDGDVFISFTVTVTEYLGNTENDHGFFPQNDMTLIYDNDYEFELAHCVYEEEPSMWTYGSWFVSYKPLRNETFNFRVVVSIPPVVLENEDDSLVLKLTDGDNECFVRIR